MNNEKYWQQMYERFERPKVPCVADLLKLATRDPVVRAHLQAWQSGVYTFEQMACALICELAIYKERVEQLGVQRLIRDLGTPTVVPVPPPPPGGTS